MQTITSVQTMQPKEVKESKSDYIHYLFELTCSPGWIVAQVRLIFVPHFNDDTRPRTPYAYVQPFRPSPQSKGRADPNVNMFSVVQIFRSNNTRKGLVVPLDAIWRPVELIPKFGKECDPTWTCETAVEKAREFYINCFSDKPTYMEVY